MPKGDSIDRLIDYLIQNGIGNYKLAFGLYGATRGFASLPKTFTSALINGDKEYFKEVWLTIYEYLFGFKINNAILQEPPTTLHQSSIGSKVIQNIGKVETVPSKRAKVISAVEKQHDWRMLFKVQRHLCILLMTFSESEPMFTKH